MGRRGLDRQTVIDAAMRLLDRVGLDGLTMRVLADELGIQPPSLYNHIRNKQELQEAVADALLASVAQSQPPGSWDVLVAAITTEMRGALLRHRDGARLFAGTYGVTANVVRVSDALIRALDSAGLPLSDAARTATTIVYFVVGFCIEEQAFPIKSTDADEFAQYRARFEAVVSGRYPLAMMALPTFLDSDFDARFVFGLGLLLDGVRARVARLERDAQS